MFRDLKVALKVQAQALGLQEIRGPSLELDNWILLLSLPFELRLRVRLKRQGVVSKLTELLRG